MKILLITDSLPLGTSLIKSFRKEGMALELVHLAQEPEKMKNLLINLTARVIITMFEDLAYFQKILTYLPEETVKIALAYDFSKLNQNWRDNYSQSYLFPFDIALITLAIRNEVFQRSKALAVECLQYNGLILHLNQRQLEVKNKSIYLRYREFCLLQFLMTNPKKLHSRISILENVWDANADGFTNTVEVHISKLRKIFKTMQIEEDLIKTIPCSGYIFG